MDAAAETILLVDDEPNVLSGYRRQLGRRYRILTAGGGEEALEILRAQPDIAVVIADMRMPRMNGIQLLTEVERQWPDVVRLMLTGNVDQETAVQAVNCSHVYRFINKPAPAEVMVEAIEGALTRYRLTQAQQELVRQAEVTRRALERERAAAKQQREFVGMVSHEFRTPLAIIDGAVEILGGPYEINEQQKTKRFKMIRDAVRRMTELMESVLDVSRLEGGTVRFNPEPVDVCALVAEVANRIGAAQNTHRVAVKYAVPQIGLQADPRLLDHILSNLLTNAIKYSPGRDRVMAVVGRTEAEVTVAVADEGVGIPESELPNLFDKFFRASTSSGIAGTGIGLYIVDQFVRLHGGRVEVRSAVGAGSVFTVILPLKAAGPSLDGA